MHRKLEPRGVGDTLGEILGVFAAHGGSIMGIVAIVTVPLLIVQAFVSRNIIDYAALANDELVLNTDALRNVLFVALFSFAASALASGAVVHAVAGVYIGVRPDIRRSVSFAASHLGVLIVASLLWMAGIIAGLFAFIVPGIVVGVGWVVFAGAALIDGTTAPGALARSWRLTSGRKLQVFGVLLALSILALIFNAVVDGIIGALGQEALSPPTPTTSLVTILANVVLSALFSTATVVMYVELRTRKEGATAVEDSLRSSFATPGDEPSGPTLIR